MTTGLASEAEQRIVPAREAYDRAASLYDGWEWQEFWRRSELPLVLDQAERLGIHGRILDAGTGTGIYAEAMERRGDRVVGLDVSAAMLARARARLGGAVPLVEGDVRALPFRDAAFDALMAARVLSHVDDLPTTLSQLRRVVREGGWVMVTDVDAAHGYDFTRVPTDVGKIPVETYKRTLDDLVAAARAAASLEPVFLHRWGADSARWVPHPGTLGGLDPSGSRPVGFVAIFTTGSGA